VVDGTRLWEEMDGDAAGSGGIARIEVGMLAADEKGGWQ